MGSTRPAKADWRRRVRLERAVIHLHGDHAARVTFELLMQLGDEFGDIDLVVELTEQFAGLDPALLAALQGNRFPPHLRRVA